MTFNEYQELTSTTAIYRQRIAEIADENATAAGCLGLSYVALGLGEVGELQGKIKKIIRDNYGMVSDAHRYDLKKELGDVLWYCSQMASELGITLDDVAEENLRKLFSRKERGVLTGSGDDR